MGKGENRRTALTATDPAFIEGVTFSSSSDLVSVTVTGKPESEQGATKLPLEVEISPDLPLGRFNETITASSGVDTLPVAQLRVGGLVVGMVEASPNSVRFLLMENAGGSMVPEFQRVQILNHDKENPLKVTDFEDPDGRLEFEIETITEGEQYNLTIRPKPVKSLEKEVDGTIIISTDNPRLSELRVGYSIVPRI